MGVMDDRRRILVNQPELVTASGTAISFRTNINAPLKECVVTYLPKQTGSGTPSPSNIRPIDMWTRIEMYIASEQGEQPQNTYITEWSANRASGYLDIANGTITHNRIMLTLTGDSGWANVGSKFYVTIPDSYITTYRNSTSYDTQYCNMYPFETISGNGSAGVTVDKRYYLQRVVNTPAWNRVWIYDSAYTLEQFKEMLNRTPLVATIPIVPETYNLSTPQIKTLIGNNYLWSDGNNIDIQYWKL